jgi:hypothetical protein
VVYVAYVDSSKILQKWVYCMRGPRILTTPRRRKSNFRECAAKALEPGTICRIYAPHRMLDTFSGLRRLQVSKDSGFAWNPDRPEGARIVRDSVIINGQPLQTDRDYRATVNSFLADGGDNLPILREGRSRVAGMLSLDALVAYFGRHTPVLLGVERRVRRIAP